MYWIYYDPESETANPRSRTLYLRSVRSKGRKEQLGSITQIKVYAMDYFFNLPNNPFKGFDYQQIYQEELGEKPFFVRENDIEPQRKNYLRHNLTIYLKTDAFSEEELLKWCRYALVEKRYEVNDIQPSKINQFQELLPENQYRPTLKQRLSRLFL